MTDGTALLITTSSMNGCSSVLKRCLPAALARWGFVVIAVLHLNACIRASFVKPVNPKPVVPVGSKVPSSGLPSSDIFCRTANGNISPSQCGTIEPDSPLQLGSLMPENGVIFSDGIEDDYLQFNAGCIAHIGIADIQGQLISQKGRQRI